MPTASLMPHHHSTIEPLEARIAPALLGSLHGVIHFTDVDGDKVTITASHDASFTATVEASGQLDLLDFTAPSANLANITISVVKVKGGDGLVNVPRIAGGTNNFGAVTIKGDLGEIDCGSGAVGAVALVKLSADSIGKATTLYQTLYATNGGEGASTISGTVVGINVTHDVNTSLIDIVTGGNLNSVTVGGSLLGGTTLSSGEIYAEGNLGTAVIKKDIVGGSNTVSYDNDYSGSIGAGHTLHSITVGGSVKGGTGMHSGYIFSGFGAAGDIDKVSVGGDVIGSANNANAGAIYADGAIHSAVIGGSIRGGLDPDSGYLGAAGDIDSLMVKGSIIGGNAGHNTGYIYGQHLGTATIKGDIIGGDNANLEGGLSFASIGKVVLAGSLRGGSGAGPDDGFIEATGDIASIFIGGSIVGQPGLVKLSGIIRAGGHLGSVEVMKDVIGGGTQTGVIEGDTGIDLVHIHGDLKGGHFDNSGYVSGNGHGIKKIIIDGQIIPGDGANSGQVRA